MAALLLPAVGRAEGKASIAPAHTPHASDLGLRTPDRTRFSHIQPRTILLLLKASEPPNHPQLHTIQSRDKPLLTSPPAFPHPPQDSRQARPCFRLSYSRDAPRIPVAIRHTSPFTGFRRCRSFSARTLACSRDMTPAFPHSSVWLPSRHNTSWHATSDYATPPVSVFPCHAIQVSPYECSIAT